MRQILYISSSALPHYEADIAGILTQSRHNNALDGITGLLWADGRHFLQVLEGPDESLDAAMKRIRADKRHKDISVLHDAQIAKREFGTWSMVHRQTDRDADAYDAQARRLLERSSVPVRETFLGLILREQR